jgi:hypothetical protein
MLNFAMKAFSEIGGVFIRNSSPLASVVALYNTAGLRSPALPYGRSRAAWC